MHLSFDDLRTDDQGVAFEMISWMNRSNVDVLSVVRKGHPQTTHRRCSDSSTKSSQRPHLGRLFEGRQIIDALFGMHLSFDDLRTDDQGVAFEMISWMNRSSIESGRDIHRQHIDVAPIHPRNHLKGHTLVVCSKVGGRVLKWEELSTRLATSDLGPDLIIDALFGMHLSFDSLAIQLRVRVRASKL
jgi:NAD(P)H-hydrate repair Nnr-like enzyme with NAD(P)H-hydrate epimerase domain